jgi:hypothetical protein
MLMLLLLLMMTDINFKTEKDIVVTRTDHRPQTTVPAAEVKKTVGKGGGGDFDGMG